MSDWSMGYRTDSRAKATLALILVQGLAPVN